MSKQAFFPEGLALPGPVHKVASVREFVDHSEELETRRAVDATRPSNREGASASALLGRVIAGRFELLEVVAEGGMGTVYRARDRELDDVVALKMLRNDLAAGGDALEFFRQEVKLARRVTHRNVARIYELGAHEGHHFLTMEFIHGEPLSATLRAHGRLSPNLAIYVLSTVCDALSAAHAAGIVHRDIKPSNILIASDGRVVLTDFGLARRGYSYDATRLVGTPAYMAPEQIEGGEITPATDVYALGAMAFELVTGQKPWQGTNVTEFASARLTSPPPDPRAVAPAVPGELARAIQRCMQPAPEDRFRSMNDAAEAFMHASPDTQVVPLSPSLRNVAASPGRPLIAILPFECASAPGDALLDGGLMDEIIDALSAVQGLRVIARGAVQKASAVSGDPRDIGRELGARIVVHGRVDAVDRHVRLTVRLSDVRDGAQIWSKRYDFERADAVQLAVGAARDIAGALSLEPSQQPQEKAADALAVELYFQARRAYHRFGFEDLGRSIDLFEQARARAPQDPLICSGLAMALARRWFWNADSAAVWSMRAREAVDTALHVAPWLGESHLAHATVLLHAGETERAARELRNAISRAPSLGEAHEMLGRMLNEAGYVREAVRHLKVARTMDPGSSVPVWELIRNAALRPDWPLFDQLMAEALAPSGERRGRWTSHLRYAAWRGDKAQLQTIADDVERLRASQSFDLSAVDAYIAVALRNGSLAQASSTMQTYAFVPGGSTRRAVFYLQMLAELAGLSGDAEVCVDALLLADRSNLTDAVWLTRCPLLESVRGTSGYDQVARNVRARAEKVFDALWS